MPNGRAIEFSLSLNSSVQATVKTLNISSNSSRSSSNNSSSSSSSSSISSSSISWWEDYYSSIYFVYIKTVDYKQKFPQCRHVCHCLLVIGGPSGRAV
jgi:hypothetical protein